MRTIKFVPEREGRLSYLQKYFTEEGIISVENRLKNLVELLFQKIEYPFEVKSYGFPNYKIKNKDWHEGMIEELKKQLNINDIIVEEDR